MNVLQALNTAMAYILRNDRDTVILGEDVGIAGGIFRATQGLQQEFGKERVIDTPLDEKGIVAHAIGLALYGIKPIVEIQFAGFIHDAHEQIMFAAAKYRWMTCGEYTVPMVIRAPSFGGIMGGIWHSHSPEAYYMHGGGIKIVAPSTPQDCYAMLLAAVQDPDPVMILEPVPLYRSLSDVVNDDGIASPIGRGEIIRNGHDVTAITYGPLRHTVLAATDDLARSHGIETEVIDLKSLIPFDIDLIVESVCRTGRCAIIHEAPQTMGFGAELAAQVQARTFSYLEAPVERICAPDVPYSYRVGDEFYKPDEQRIKAGLKRVAESLV